MSKLKNSLVNCVSIIAEIQKRQQHYLDRVAGLENEAKITLKKYGAVHVDPANVPGVKEEKAAAAADIVAMKKRLAVALDELLEADQAARVEFVNADSVALSNVLKVVELTGADLTNAQAVGMVSPFKGDYIAMRAVSEMLRKAENSTAAEAVSGLVPDIPALVRNARAAADPVNSSFSQSTSRLARPFFAAADKLGDDIGSKDAFTDLFEVEHWRESAGLL